MRSKNLVDVAGLRFSQLGALIAQLGIAKLAASRNRYSKVRMDKKLASGGMREGEAMCSSSFVFRYLLFQLTNVDSDPT